jgi:hypothetical protein
VDLVEAGMQGLLTEDLFELSLKVGMPCHVKAVRSQIFLARVRILIVFDLGQVNDELLKTLEAERTGKNLPVENLEEVFSGGAKVPGTYPMPRQITDSGQA